MSRNFVVTLSKEFVITTEDTLVEITSNLEDYIDKDNLALSIANADGLGDVFDIMYRKLDDEEKVCAICGDFLSDDEISENSGLICNGCAEDVTDAEDITSLP